MTAAPTSAVRSPAPLPRSERMRAPVATAAGVLAATYALHVRDPHVAHSWGVCPLYALTGIYCPACGCLRAVNDLGNRHLAEAASSNLLLILAIPFAAVFFLRWSYGAWTGRDVAPLPTVPRAVQILVIALVAAFTVARNLPSSWLAP